MKKFIEEFKAFIAKGSVIDMAVAVVVGGAFSKIVSSLVNDIIMPLIGLIAGGVNISSLKWVIREAVIDTATGAVVKEEAALTYGVFLQSVLDFLIISLCIFIVLKVLLLAKDRIIKKKEVKEESEEEKKESVEDILSEIRDMMKNDADDSEK